jgi:uncharacterized membrane protein YfcA
VDRPGILRVSGFVVSYPLDLLSFAWPGIDIALAAGGLMLAGIVKGITGIGYATCAMPLLAVALGLETALAIVVVPAIISNAAVLAGGGAVVQTLNRFRLLYAGILPGIVGGTALLSSVESSTATAGLAVMTLIYVAFAVARPQLALPAGLEQPLALPTGVLNGVLTGLTGSQILPLVPYMMALRLDASTQVQAINLAVMIGSVALGAALIGSGMMTGELLALSCAGAFPAVAGTLLGNALRAHLDVGEVRRVTLAVLVLMAIGLGSGSLFQAVPSVAPAAMPAGVREPVIAAHGACARLHRSDTGCPPLAPENAISLDSRAAR